MLITELVGDVKNLRKRGRPSNSLDEERENEKLNLLFALPTESLRTVLFVVTENLGRREKEQVLL